MKITTAEAGSRTFQSVIAASTDLPLEVDVPGITATSRMIELMEAAAARLMKPRLNAGETSVGVRMNITFAAHRLHQPGFAFTMRAAASSSGSSGRLHRFIINAFDETGLIGTAEHTRTVLERRLVSRESSDGQSELLA